MDDFDALVAPHRAALHACCYRLLGSVADADDALQETLLSAWRAQGELHDRGALRSWLFTIATRACLRMIGARGRLLPMDFGPASGGIEVAGFVDEPLWLEPYPEPADAELALRESIELAFVAALQHLPATQRAALVLCEVLDFSAAEVAVLLETSVASVTSALQRARATVARRVPPVSQQATRAALGATAERALVDAYVAAWAERDVDALVALFAYDVRFSMPPIPTWFDGVAAVGRFFGARVFATAWRLVPVRASGQLAFACYQGPDFRLGALNVVTLRGGLIAELTGFLHPQLHARFSLPPR